MTPRALTAREALLVIGGEVEAAFARAESKGLGTEGSVWPRFRSVVEQGLSCDAMENFELSDLLADRLADSHRILRQILHAIERGKITGEVTAFDIPATLALPPDLEAMIERRLRT